MAQRVRSVFISDVHLGTRACQAERLLGFLKAYDSRHLYLVGDIIDFWAMKSRGVYWSEAQNTVVQKILKRARHDVDVVFVPGNHVVHTAADGRRYLVIHGDEFDQVTRYHKWLALLGDSAYAVLVHINAWLSWLRRTLGIAGYWSLAGYAKRKVKGAVSFICDFEESLLRHAKSRGADGVICGHIHAAAIREAAWSWCTGCSPTAAATSWKSRCYRCEARLFRDERIESLGARARNGVDRLFFTGHPVPAALFDERGALPGICRLQFLEPLIARGPGELGDADRRARRQQRRVGPFLRRAARAPAAPAEADDHRHACAEDQAPDAILHLRFSFRFHGLTSIRISFRAGALASWRSAFRSRPCPCRRLPGSCR